MARVLLRVLVDLHSNSFPDVWHTLDKTWKRLYWECTHIFNLKYYFSGTYNINNFDDHPKRSPKFMILCFNMLASKSVEIIFVIYSVFTVYRIKMIREFKTLFRRLQAPEKGLGTLPNLMWNQKLMRYIDHLDLIRKLKKELQFTFRKISSSLQKTSYCHFLFVLGFYLY